MAKTDIGTFNTTIEVEQKLTKKKLDNFLITLQYYCDDYNEMVDKIYKKYSTELQKELGYIIRKNVDAFYEAYEPNIYHRRYDLYSAFRVHVNDQDDEWYIEAGYDIPTSTVDKYIFEFSLKKGYHGAHPKRGTDTPWWREPVPYYTQWYKPAVQTSPVYDLLVDEASQAIDKYSMAADEECKEQYRIMYQKIQKRLSLINFYS